LIVTLTGIVEFFGDPATRSSNPAKFLTFNLPSGHPSSAVRGGATPDREGLALGGACVSLPRRFAG
jgi:hypothetical protein